MHRTSTPSHLHILTYTHPHTLTYTQGWKILPRSIALNSSIVMSQQTKARRRAWWAMTVRGKGTWPGEGGGDGRLVCGCTWEGLRHALHTYILTPAFSLMHFSPPHPHTHSSPFPSMYLSLSTHSYTPLLPHTLLSTPSHSLITTTPSHSLITTTPYRLCTVHGRPRDGHLQPIPRLYLPGHDTAPLSLLHRLLPQHVSQASWHLDNSLVIR